ncbi:MAG: iron ABC transporter substrate-binding protein, partial [Halobacteria archaeon]|nr:iron ABC transporter substrate-binding protein [Halobacteria archaeon]
PVGDIPTIDQLNPPDIDFTKLSNIQPTLELMREVGIRV